MINVFIRKIEELSEEESNRIVSSLSEKAQAHLDKKRNVVLQHSSLCALSLLTDEQRADLDYTESCRPNFATLDNDISISHSRSFCAVAISNSKDQYVGIDIEDCALASNIHTRFFTENERAKIESGASAIEIWTKKEALFKYLKNDNIQFMHLDSTVPEIYDAKFITLAIEDNILTVCSKKETMIQII